MPIQTKPKRIKEIKFDINSGEIFTMQGVTANDRLYFSEQLALLLETGSSLVDALQAIAKQIKKPKFKEIIIKITDDITEGNSFSQALSRHKHVFSLTYINLIRASEGGGFIHKVLRELVEMDKKRAELQNTLVSALFYPGFLIVFSMVVVCVIIFFVVPKFTEVFAEVGSELPTSTKFLVWLSNTAESYGIVILLVLGTLIFLVARWAKSDNGIRQIDRLKLSIPFVRNIFSQLYLTYSFRVLGLSLKNGVNITDALRACKEVINNSLFREFITEVETSVQEGSGIATALSNNIFVAPTVEQMIAAAEQSGSLPHVLLQIAEQSDNQLKNTMRLFSKIVEPTLLLVMGLIVGLLVSALILPIFSLSSSIN